MGLPGLGRLHPFDFRRAVRVRRALRGLEVDFAAPAAGATDEELAVVHSREHLQSLHESGAIAEAIEVPTLGRLPAALLEWILVTPMRWAVAGTLLAAREALRTGLAFNLAGGFHHAKPDRAEGFCLFNDIAYAVRSLQLEKVLYVDLDAHQGNGVAACFADDPRMKLFDVFNASIYPQDAVARARIDAPHPVSPGTDGADYLELLGNELPSFLDQGGDLLVLNAGSDVVAGDSLGGLQLSPAAVLQRDLLVLRQARRRQLPLLFLPSGGYSRSSYRLIADSIRAGVQERGQTP